MRLLLVEDNQELSRWLCAVLQEEAFQVDCVHDAEMANALLAGEHYDAVLLDLKLPNASGQSVLRRLRRQQNQTPVMVLTASDSLDMKVECLETGADDYMVKPFEVRELVARIKALIRRHSGSATPTLGCADLNYDTNTRQFQLSGRPLTLPPREHSLLEALLLNQGKTMSKASLMQSVFGLGAEASEDALEIYVHRLRRKLESSQAAIVTLRGLGYLLTPRQAS
ncbi:response regulator transcription factor [Candidimonas nitroreducens]|uniref:DNA-binding response regulator n=1 Tax=Candidimonas nitroreducens TaxID=683354 RepID=A0A225M8J1_9BURK|nr:response regulator transcription factor [Candidimonas nitroreducens]OWT57647.1 DNA-binding response regulator [Candidimonas nitroreducens]